MRDLENLRRHLDEPPASDEAREAARAALRERYARAEGRLTLKHGVLLAAGVALASAVLVILTTRTGPAVAWSPTPVTPPEPLLLASASAECADVLDQFDGSMPPLIIDQRDDVAMALFGDRSAEEVSMLSCTLRNTDDGGWERVTADDLPFTLFSVSGSVDEELLGSRIERVVIDTGDALVDVSYEDGFYLIWWPEDVALTGHPMRFLAPDGSTVLEMPVNESRHRDGS